MMSFTTLFLSINISEYNPRETEELINNEILDLIVKRDKLLKNFHRSKDELIYKDFCKTRNMVQRLIKETKRQYILEQTEKNKKDSKKLWSVLKSLGYNHKCKSKEPMILNINNSVCFDPLITIANYTNCFFS